MHGAPLQSALFLAARAGKWQALKPLLDARADITLVDSKGQVPSAPRRAPQVFSTQPSPAL